ncbi:MAG: hypothetical protein DMF62_11740 [Acidobacteria bacterium]|nr:MAG: hypothetical protein DMF62_11740 [Acidobacteriota bacterium]
MKISDLIALLQQCDSDTVLCVALRDANDDFLCMPFAEPVVTRQSAGMYFLNVKSRLVGVK